jgi:hypothetical protein
MTVLRSNIPDSKTTSNSNNTTMHPTSLLDTALLQHRREHACRHHCEASLRRRRVTHSRSASLIARLRSPAGTLPKSPQVSSSIMMLMRLPIESPGSLAVDVMERGDPCVIAKQQRSDHCHIAQNLLTEFLCDNAMYTEDSSLRFRVVARNLAPGVRDIGYRQR